MAQERTLSIVIKATDEASAKLKGMGKSISDSFGKISTAAGVVGAGVLGFAGMAVKGFVEAERSTRQLEHAVLDVSKGTKEQVSAIMDVTKALEKKAGLDGDAIAMGAAQLSTFGLQTDTVLKLTKSLADLTVNQKGVTASSDDYIGSANVIAKALQGQFGALEQSGIRFTEAQQKMILYGKESEKAAAITEGLNQNLRETSDTIANTTEAQFAKLNNSIGDIQDAIGSALLPTVNRLADALLPIVNKIAAWAEENPDLITTITAVVLGVSGFLAVIAPLGAAISAVGTAVSFFGAALAFVAANPIVLIIAAIAGIIAVVVYMIKHWDEVSAKVREVVGAIGEKLSEFGAKIAEIIKGISDQTVASFSEMWNQAKDAFMTGIYFVLGVVDFLTRHLLGISLPELSQQFLLAWQIFSDAVVTIVRVLSETIIAIWNAIKGAADTFFKEVMGIVEAFKEPITNLWNGIWNGLKDSFTGIMEAVKAPIQSVFDWITDKLDAIKKMAQAIGSAVSSAFGGAVSSGKAVAGKRALGGPVSSGRTYLVGENGPELFTAPGGGGTIIPNGRFGGGVGVNVSINVGSVGNNVDVQRMAQMVGDQIMFKLKQNMGV